MSEAMTDNDLSPQIAARLIAEQFPELAPKLVRLQAALGADNHIFRTGDDRCARFVKVSRAAEAAHRQVAALPRFSGAPLCVRSAKFMDAPARLPDADRAWAARLWSEAVRTQPACETVWLHGDVHPGNVLIWNARISGILDWALCGVGDGACDLRFRTARRLSPCAGGHRRRMAARRGGRCRWRSFICPTRMKMDYPVTCPRK